MTASYDLGRPPGREQLLSALAMAPQRLDLAALAIARVHRPFLDPVPTLERLDALATRVREVPGERLAALVTVLGDEEGLTGDRARYDDPDNSCLDLVLERACGLPILLSVVFMEVGWRAGVECSGLALPGHFMIAHAGQVLDPFDGGRRLTRAQCVERVRRVVPDATLTDDDFRPATVESICWRMLNNLRGSYQRRGDQEQVLRTVDLMLVLRPNHPTELRARAEVLTKLGALPAAVADLERVLATNPPDATALRKTTARLKDRLGPLN